MSNIFSIPSTINVNANITVGSQFTGQNIVLSGATLPLQIHDTAGANVFVVSGPSVGLGTNAPTTTLDVRGLGSFTNLAVQTAMSGNTLNLAGALIGATTGSFASMAAQTSISGNNVNLAGTLLGVTGSFTNLGVTTSISGNNINLAAGIIGATGSFSTVYSTTSISGNALNLAGALVGATTGSFASIATTTSISGASLNLTAGISGTTIFLSGNALPLVAHGTGQANAFIVSGNGLIGIGTNNPSYNLDVRGNIKIPLGSHLYFNSGTTVESSITTVDAFGTTRIRGADGFLIQVDTPGIAWDTLFNIGDNGGVGIGMSGATAQLNISGGRFVNSLLIHASGAANALTVTSGGLVGIGTNIPTTLLDVRGAGAFNGDLTIGSANNGNANLTFGGTPTTNATSRLRFITSNTARNWQISTNDSATSALEFTPSTAAGGGTFTTAAMVISGNGGAVGIGITSPSTALHVSGTTSVIQLNGSGFNINGNPGITRTVITTTGSLFFSGGIVYAYSGT